MRAALCSSVLLLAVSACRDFTPPADAVTLPIEDRAWEAGAPPEGWCGEASVQMAALHFGTWLPQAEINRHGAPKTPDLWEHDVPTALTSLGLQFERGPQRETRALFAWVLAQLRAGAPVVLGLKFVDSPHPEWDVDHLVLVTGFDARGLRLNTNQHEGLVIGAWKGLSSAEGSAGYTLKNRSGTRWAFAVQGFVEKSGVSARVVREDEAHVTLELTSSTRGVLLRDGVELGAFEGPQTISVPRDAPTRFRVKP